MTDTADIDPTGAGEYGPKGNPEDETVFFPPAATTADQPAYVLGGVYFDTTLNKLCVGGATAWETVSSS